MCECIEKMNVKLAEHNGKVARAVQVTDSLSLVARTVVQTEKVDKSKRKPIPVMMATFCPFCGEREVPAAV